LATLPHPVHRRSTMPCRKCCFARSNDERIHLWRDSGSYKCALNLKIALEDRMKQAHGVPLPQ
jgi:hypothetical protein